MHPERILIDESVRPDTRENLPLVDGFARTLDQNCQNLECPATETHWGAMNGDRTLFARQDYVEEAWRIVDPVLKKTTPIYEYEAGSWGPREVDGNVAPPGGWQNPIAR